MHLGLGSTELFFLTFVTSVWASVSPAFHVGSAEGGPPVGRVSAVTVSGQSNTSHRGVVSEAFLFRLCAKITAACWMSWRVRAILQFGQEAWPHERRVPLSWHSTCIVHSWCCSCVDVCVKCVCESLTQIALLGLGESCCSDCEFYLFCLLCSFRWLLLRHRSCFTASQFIGVHH